MKDLEALQDQFPLIQQSYLEIKQNTEAKIKTWVWASSEFVSLEPFYFEQNHIAKGRLLKQEPEKKADKMSFGLDENGQIIAQRQYTAFENYYETFYNRTPAAIETYRFGYDKEKKLINITRYLYDKDILKKYLRIATGGNSIHDYQYENTTLVKKIVQHKAAAATIFTDRILEYEYDKYGILEAIKTNDHYWYRKPENITFTQLTLIAEQQLTTVIKRNITNHCIKEELFCLALNYGNENHYPPSIAYGTVSEKNKWLIHKGKDAMHFIWNPAEYKLNFDLKITDEEAKFFAMYNQQTAIQEKHILARKSILNVAADLKKGISGFKLNMADPFVIIVSDYDLGDLKKNFKLINPERYDEFKKQLPY